MVLPNLNPKQNRKKTVLQTNFKQCVPNSQCFTQKCCHEELVLPDGVVSFSSHEEKSFASLRQTQTPTAM